MKLPQPTVVDLAINPDQVAVVEIQLRKHKFAADARATGMMPDKSPIFGGLAWLEAKGEERSGKRRRGEGERSSPISDIDIGLPVFRFKRGTKPHVKFINNTDFTFNLHWHGLNTTADVDGASTEVVFGPTTKIGRVLDLNFPEINNNSALLWLHATPDVHRN